MTEPAEPEMLRGALQSMADGATWPFVGEQELLINLHQLVASADEIPPPEEESDEKERKADQG
jgi:hypothetical protein